MAVVPDAPSPGHASGAESLDRAHGLLRLALIVFVVGSGLGIAWDRAWHATHPFEDFWSPPHVLIYTSYAVTAGVFARLVVSPDLRAWFGLAWPVPLIGRELPGSIAITASGLAAIGLGGLLDNIWHSRFGLDETGWSLPHALLGWGILLTVIGFVACRLVLRPHRPLSRVALALFGVFLLSVVTDVLLGPIGRNNTPELLQRVAALPVLAAEEPVQHTFRIYAAWNITRTNPLFVPLAAVAAGVGLALVRGLVRGTGTFLLVVLLVSVFSLSGDHRTARYFGLAADARNWLPLPLLPAALVLVPREARDVVTRWTWSLAGIVFGAFAVLIWGASPILILIAAPAMVVGAHLGERLAGIVEAAAAGPTKRLIAIAFGMPVVLGVVDLVLRASTR